MSRSASDENAHHIEPLAVRVPEACRISGIGQSKLYELIKAQDIAIIKVGTITLIPMESLKAYLESDDPLSGAV